MRYSWYYAGMWPYIGKISKEFSTSLQLQPLWRHPDIQLKTHKYVDPIFSQLHHELFSEFCIHWGQLPLAAHGNGHSNLGEFKGIAVSLLVAKRFLKTRPDFSCTNWHWLLASACAVVYFVHIRTVWLLIWRFYISHDKQSFLLCHIKLQVTDSIPCV